jgi:hypothetical protein
MRGIRLAVAAFGWLAVSVALPAWAQSNISVSNTSRYVASGRWDWTVFIQASPAVLSQIKCVEYALHPTFPNPVRQVCDRGKDSQAFALNSNGWGEFTIQVTVFFRSGETQHLKYALKLAAPSTASRDTKSTVPGVSCKTQISLSIPEGAVRRLKGGLPYIVIYAEEIHESRTSHFYVVNTKQELAQESERLSQKDFAQRLTKSGIRQTSGVNLATDTYNRLSLDSDKSGTLDLPSGKLAVAISNPHSHKSVDVSVCPPQ